MSTHILNAGRAAWVSEAATSKSFHGRPSLTLDGSGTDEKRAFLWFPNPLLTLGDEVTSASLVLFLKGGWTGTITVTAKRVIKSWNPRTVKWGQDGTNPTVTNTNSATVVVTNGLAGDMATLDLTAMLNDVAAGGEWHGVRLEINANGPLRVYSPNAASPAVHPRLEVSLAVDPDAPDKPRPSGGVAVDAVFPTFKWEFDSSDANAYQAESRVQVTTTEGNYSSPVYDTGWEANFDQQWDSTTDAPTLPIDEYWWHVAVRDQNGAESEYSDEAAFVREPIGDVVIDAPGQDGDDVSDNTPTVTAFADFEARQVRWRVLDSLGAVLYERPWAFQDEEYTGVDTWVYQWTVPDSVPTRQGNGPAIISEAGESYGVEVSMRDAYARPDADVATDTRTFDFVPGTSVTAFTNLTASVDGSEPWVTLLMTRASTPDFVLIERDGVIIDEVEGADLLVSGTTFSYVDYGASPRTLHTYTVRAKTTGTGVSQATTGASVATNPAGVWLIYAESGAPVADYSELIMSYNPIGYWRLGEAPGSTVAADSSGNDFHAVITGSGDAEFGAPGLLTSDDDTAYLSDVSLTHYLTHAFNSTLAGAAPLTLIAWCKPNVSDSNQVMDMGASNAGWEITTAGTPSDWKVRWGNGAGFPYVGQTPVVAGEKVMVLGTHDGTTATTYVNGAFSDDNVAGFTPTTTEVLKIAHDFDGVIDEVAILPVALTPAQAAELYAAGVAAMGEGQSRFVVPILGDEAIPVGLSERSEVFEPLNRQDPVKINSRVGGYNGSVNGTVAAWHGYQVDDLLADLEQVFYLHSTEKIRLVFGKRNITVNVGDLVADQHPIPASDEAQHRVSFNFWQTGDFAVTT